MTIDSMSSIPAKECPHCQKPLAYCGGDYYEETGQIIRRRDYVCSECNTGFRFLERFQKVSECFDGEYKASLYT